MKAPKPRGGMLLRAIPTLVNKNASTQKWESSRNL